MSLVMDVMVISYFELIFFINREILASIGRMEYNISLISVFILQLQESDNRREKAMQDLINTQEERVMQESVQNKHLQNQEVENVENSAQWIKHIEQLPKAGLNDNILFVESLAIKYPKRHKFALKLLSKEV